MKLLELHEAYKQVMLSENKQDTALKTFSEAFSPDTFAMIQSNWPLWGFFEMLKVYDKELYDDYSYYTWEAPMMEEAIVTRWDKKWNFRNEAEFLAYIQESYQII